MFIQTEATPNPETLKFLPGQSVLGEGTLEFADPEKADAASPLASAILGLPGVERVFLGGDFISISKASTADWKHVKPMALAAIMDHYTSGMPVLNTDAASFEAEDEHVYEGDAAEIVAEIKELIETRIRPAVAQDGGDIVFDRFDVDTGLVMLHMRGACAGCPSSTMTLKQGIENMLRHYVPEVTAVEASL